MSKDVEDKVVSLTFKNEKFKSAAADTLKVLQQMQDGLKKLGSTTASANVKPTLNALDAMKAKLTGLQADKKPLVDPEPTLGALERLKAKFTVFRTETTGKPLVDMSPSIRTLEEFGAKATTVAGTSTMALGNIQGAADGVDMAPAGESASGASAKFVAFGVAAGAALFAIGAKAVQMAGNLASAFTLDPMKAGFQEFEVNMGSIQTILANTDRYGTKLPEVEGALDRLNEYSDKTIYNFGQMVKNVGLFTNAGIKIGDATAMIEGFSNVAAASGTNAEQAAGAAYQLSQALSAGKVTLMDWRSLQNAGMGNKNMQQGVIELAEAMGTLGPAGTNATEIQENFNGSLEKGWLKADVMSNYLKIMAGDLDATEMATLGLTEAQVKWYQRQATIANEAATKVRTFTQLISTVKESIGSGWSMSFRNIIGGFEEGTTLFTGINNFIGGMVKNSADARNKMLKQWHDFGGRNAAIEGLMRTVAGLKSVIDPVRLAFREMFPRQTAEGLLHLTDNFRNFTKGLMASKTTVDNIHRIFAGLFALIKIGASIIWQLGKMVITTFKDAFGGATSVGIVPFIASIADVIAGVSRFLSEGGRLKNFFASLQGAIHHVLGPFKGLIQIFIAIGRAAGAVFGGVFRIVIDTFRQLFGVTDKAKGAGDKAASFLDKITRGTIYAVYYINEFTDKIRGFFSALHDFLGMMKDPIKALQQLKAAFTAGFDNPFDTAMAQAPGVIGYMVKLGEAVRKIKDAFIGGFDDPFAKVDTGGITGGLIKVGQAFGKIWDKIQGFGEGGKAIFDGIKKSIVEADWLGMLKDVGHKLKESFMSAIDAHSPSRMFIEAAKSIPQGIAEGIRSAWDSIKSVFTDGAAKLKEWFGGIRDAFDEASQDVDWNQVIQGGGIVALLGFVKTLSDFRKDFGGLLGHIGGTFDELGGALQGLQKKLKAEAMKELAIAIAILVASVLILTFVDSDKLKLSLAAIAVGFAELAGTMKLMEKMGKSAKNMLGIGAAFLGLGIAITLLATSVKMLSKLSGGQLATGLGGVAALMGGMVIAMNLMPDAKDLGPISLAFLAMGASIAIMAFAVKTIGEMGSGPAFQGVMAIAALATILVLAANQMTEALPGAAALVAAAGSILIVAEAVKIVGELDFEQIKNGTLAIAALMFMLVLATNSMETAMPGAIAMVAVAGGVLILAQAMTIIGELSIGQIFASLGAIAALIGILALFVVAITATGGIAIPAMEALGTTLLLVGAGFALIGVGAYLAAEALRIFAENGSKGMDTFVEMMKRMIGLIPELVGAFVESIIDTVIQLADRFPEVLDSLGNAFLSLLEKMQELMPPVFETLEMFLSGLIGLVVAITPQLIAAAFTMITSFLIELTAHALEFGAAAAMLISQFILGIASNILPLVTAAVTLITNFLNALTLQLPLIIAAGVNLIVTFINGITAAIPRIAGAVTQLIVTLIGEVAKNALTIATAGTDAVIAFLGGMASNAVRLATAVTMTTVYIITTIVDGLFDAIVTVASSFVDIVCEFLNQMATVMREGGPKIGTALSNFADGFVDGIVGAFKTSLGAIDWSGLIGGFIPDSVMGIDIPGLGGDKSAQAASKELKAAGESMNDTMQKVSDGAQASTDSVQTSLLRLASVLDNVKDIDPTITPVLDLSQVMADARKIDGMVESINPVVSLGAANLISSTEDVRGNNPDDGIGGTVINKTFVQNNYSPEALSANDIYRSTKSQFAMEKEDLEIA